MFYVYVCTYVCMDSVTRVRCSLSFLMVLKIRLNRESMLALHERKAGEGRCDSDCSGKSVQFEKGQVAAKTLHKMAFLAEELWSTLVVVDYMCSQVHINIELLPNSYSVCLSICL